MRGLRTIPVVLGHRPGHGGASARTRWFLNYTNPMAMLVRAVAERERHPDRRAVPLRVLDRRRAGRATSGVPSRGGRRTCRPASTTSPSSCGSSTAAGTCTRTCDAFVGDGRVPDDDLVRAELSGASASTPRSRRSTTPSTTRGSSPRATRWSAFHIPIGEYLTAVANNLDEYAETKRKLDAGEPFEIERSGEYAAVIVNSMRPASRPGSSPTSTRTRGALIPNLAADACVEVPASSTGSGVHPTAVGPLPPQCAAYIRPAVDTQELTVGPRSTRTGTRSTTRSSGPASSRPG